jgi:putative aldouronate transport system substrate-binding protein
MKKSVSIVSFLSLLVVAVTALTAVGYGKDGKWNGSMPITKEPIEITVMVKQRYYVPNWNDTLLWKTMEKKTGINAKFIMVPEQSATEKFNLSLASGNYPDAYIAPHFTNAQVIAAGADGIFVSLKDYFKTDAPNFSKIMKQMPAVRKAITTPDGKIYTMPKVNMDPDSAWGDTLQINKTWLDKLGVKTLPKSIDELTALYKRFLDQDANGNGVRDEIPLTAEANLTEIINFFKGSYGLGNRGYGSPNVDVGPDGKLRYIPTDKAFRAMLRQLAIWYKAGLLNNEIFTTNSAKQYGYVAKHTLGSYLKPNNMYQTADQKFVTIDNPLVAKGYKPVISQSGPSISTGGTMGSNGLLITSRNKHIHETIRWADYFYGDEGARLMLMGVKGITYYVDKDGKYQYEDKILNDPKGYIQAISQYVTWTSIQLHGIKTAKYGGNVQNYGPDIVAARKKLLPYAPKETWPEFMFTSEESDRVVALENEMSTFYKNAHANFVTGKLDINNDKDWKLYCDTLRNIGAVEYLKIYTAAYRRYKKA